MSGPVNGGGDAGGGATVTPTPSGPIGGHLSRLIGSVSPPHAAGGKSPKPKPTASKPKASAGKPKAKPGKRRGGK